MSSYVMLFRRESRQPEARPLTESADECLMKLEALKALAVHGRLGTFRSTTEAVLSQVITHVDASVLVLKDWKGDVLQGQQTPDKDIIQNVDHYFKRLESDITNAHDAVKQRLHTQLCCWTIVYQPNQKEEASTDVTKALIEIDRTIEQLRYTSRKVVVGTADQQVYQSEILVVDHQTTIFEKFQSALRTTFASGQHPNKFDFLSTFWDELPDKPDLHKVVNNKFNPGDGVMYTASELETAKNVLEDYHKAWADVAIPASPAISDELSTIHSFANMSKICLVLKGMGSLHLFACFHESQKSEAELPLPQDELENILPEDKTAARIFATEQYRVVRRKWREGEHIDISAEEPLPLSFDHEYAAGSFGTVLCLKDVDSEELFARKEQVGHDAGDHLKREMARLQRVQHRHIVQFVKSYKRAERLGFLLRPAADGDLEKLLAYSKDPRETLKTSERERELRDLFLTAFGCLSHGLCHIHSRDIRHKDIKPNNILFQKTQPATFLWADFGLAHDFQTSKDSRTFNPSKYSARYAPPESAETDQSVLDAKAAVLDNEHGEMDSDELSEHSPSAALPREDEERSKMPAHGRSADIFSYGCVFIEILSVLVNSKIPQSEAPDFSFCKHIPELQRWTANRAKLLEPADPLRVLFSLAANMISYSARQRPIIQKVVIKLINSSTPKLFFCAACLPEVERESAAWLAARANRPPKTGEQSLELSASGTESMSFVDSDNEESGLPTEPVAQADYLSPATATRSRLSVDQSSSGLSQTGTR